jgi:hypothetical protein
LKQLHGDEHERAIVQIAIGQSHEFCVGMAMHLTDIRRVFDKEGKVQ